MSVIARERENEKVTRHEIRIESTGDFASMVYNFAKFDGTHAVENPPDHYNKCFSQ